MAGRTKITWEGNKALRRGLVPIGNLKPHPRNPRKHVLPEIVKSLQRFGQQRPVLCLPDSTIVAGHGTTLAAADIGWTHIAVVRSDLTDEEIEGYLLADNRTSDLGGYENAMLTDLLKEQYDAGRLEGTGYSPDDFEDLLAQQALVGQPDIDETERPFAETPEELADRAARRAASDSVREVVLTLDDEQHEKLSVAVKILKKEWDLAGVTETIYEAVIRAAKNP